MLLKFKHSQIELRMQTLAMCNLQVNGIKTIENKTMTKKYTNKKQWKCYYPNNKVYDKMNE